MQTASVVQRKSFHDEDEKGVGFDGWRPGEDGKVKMAAVSTLSEVNAKISRQLALMMSFGARVGAEVISVKIPPINTPDQ